MDPTRRQLQLLPEKEPPIPVDQTAIDALIGPMAAAIVAVCLAERKETDDDPRIASS